MVSSLLTCLVKPPQTTSVSANNFTNPNFQRFQDRFFPISSCRIKPQHVEFNKNDGRVFLRSPHFMQTVFPKSVIPLVASLAIVFGSNPAHAGILSGFPGIESVPGPQLPQINFLNRFNEENQKMYAENDARFKESPLLKKLLEKSKLNKEKNRQETLDKYCLRGAEWGVGDCSTDGMTPEDRDKFIAMLKQKAGIE